MVSIVCGKYYNMMLGIVFLPQTLLINIDSSCLWSRSWFRIIHYKKVSWISDLDALGIILLEIRLVIEISWEYPDSKVTLIQCWFLVSYVDDRRQRGINIQSMLGFQCPDAVEKLICWINVFSIFVHQHVTIVL